MTPQHIISQLLASDAEYHGNLNLLKKIILTSSLGRFQVNGLPPDRQISLSDYLFDDEQIMFDFTRLSDNKKALFNQWLLAYHQKDKEQTYLNPISVNEHRGFTAEVTLSWWGRLSNWLKGTAFDLWKLNEFTLSLDYQITGIQMCHGKQGILIGFKQFLAPVMGTKYKDLYDTQREPLGNTKRIFITDRLVDQLTDLSFDEVDFESILKKPHPHSIDVINAQARIKDMYDYRKMQKFVAQTPWYTRIWLWFLSWFDKTPDHLVDEPLKQDLNKLYETDTIRIYERSITKELIVVEKKPDIDNVVFCGGGSNILAHVGVWKALNEAQIVPTKFAGSSAGAIISLLCYMGYSADELIDIFKGFRQEHVVHFDVNAQGLSSSQSLKTALDYFVAKKIMDIVTQYNIPYPKGKIRFETLDALRRQCDNSVLGKQLIITTTNIRLRQTHYFSLSKSPHEEPTNVAATSASLPVLFRPTLINGEPHNDGGVLSNFPTEAFSDDHSTLLESEYGNNLKILAVQFNNGTERDTVDKIMKPVYRENFIINWIYGLLTGVDDPASGWEQDRMKLRKYAGQSIIIDLEPTPYTSLQVEENAGHKVIENGYNATKNYLNVRHSNKEGQQHKNQELMYSTFSSLGDLLAYCCYRGNLPWFDKVNELIINSSLPNKILLMEQAEELRSLYFNPKLVKEKSIKEQPHRFFGTYLPNEDSESDTQYPELLLAIYPIFIKLTSELLRSKADKKLFDQARHSLRIEAPLDCLIHFEKVRGDIHILLSILIDTLKDLKENSNEKSLITLKEIENLFNSQVDLLKPEFYGQWNLTTAQNLRILKAFKNEDTTAVTRLCGFLKQGIEPLRTIVNGNYYDDFDEASIELDIKSLKVC